MNNWIDVRPVVKWFAEQMELQLRKNDHKGGWLNDESEELLVRLKEETKELEKEIQPFRPVEENVVKEAADVANFAMMIADNNWKRIGQHSPLPEPPSSQQKDVETIGKILTEAIRLHELNPDIVEQELKLPKGILKQLMDDNFYTNSVPVVLFKNLILSLHIPLSKIEAAMLPTFKLVLSKETPDTIKKKPCGYGLWENEESVNKYTNHLKELFKGNDVAGDENLVTGKKLPDEADVATLHSNKSNSVEPKTHDTFVMGMAGGRVKFIKSYHYPTQKDEAQKDLLYCQNTDNFPGGWYLSHVGSWILQSRHQDGDFLPIDIPLPDMSNSEQNPERSVATDDAILTNPDNQK